MQTTVEFLGFSSPHAVILPHTDQTITAQLVDDIIPSSVWDTFKSTADFHGFDKSTVLAQQKRTNNIIIEVLQVFWDQAHSLQSNGYQIQELKLNIEFKSKVAGLISNLESSANQMGGSFIKGEIPYPAKSSIVTTTTTIHPERIRDVIDAVQQGQQPSELSTDFIHAIKDYYPKDRNLDNVEIVSMSDEERHLNLFEIAINYSICFFRPQPTRMLTGQTSEVLLSSSSNQSTEVSLANTQVATTRHSYSIGIFEHRFSSHEKHKSVSSEPNSTSPNI